jgi:hypothetical protein
MHEDCLIRIHCGRILHNPRCGDTRCIQLSRGKTAAVRNYDVDCTNYIVCNKDFYASPRQLRYGEAILNCEEYHISPKSTCIIVTKRTFEVLFNDVFDDHIFGTGIEFTGYNRGKNIAFTHLADKIPNRCVDNAARWCTSNNVEFIIIPAAVTTSADIDRIIIRELYSRKLHPGPEVEAYEALRREINIMNSAHQMFPVRLYK